MIERWLYQILIGMAIPLTASFFNPRAASPDGIWIVLTGLRAVFRKLPSLDSISALGSADCGRRQSVSDRAGCFQSFYVRTLSTFNRAGCADDPADAFIAPVFASAGAV